MFLSVCYKKGIALGTSDMQRVKQENTSLFVKFPLQRMAKKKNNQELSFTWYYDLTFSKILWLMKWIKGMDWDNIVVSHRVIRKYWPIMQCHNKRDQEESHLEA